MFVLITFRFSITNFGSEFPDPKGANLLTSLKKSSFKALAAIIASIYRFCVLSISILILSKFFIKKSRKISMLFFFKVNPPAIL